jgi:hypothetical protein
MSRENVLLPGLEQEWRCVCGNDSHSEGFWPCMPDGRYVQPVKDGEWDGIHNKCVRCGRIVDQRTGDVVGRQEDEPCLHCGAYGPDHDEGCSLGAKG